MSGKKGMRRCLLWLGMLLLLSFAGCSSKDAVQKAAGELELDYRDEDGNLLSRDEAKAQLKAAQAAAGQERQETALPGAEDGEGGGQDQIEDPGETQGNQSAGQSQIRFQNVDPEGEVQTEAVGQSQAGGSKNQNKTDGKKDEKQAEPAGNDESAGKPGQPSDKPSQGDQQQGDDNAKKNTVTISIRCDTAVANGMHEDSKWAGIVPASGTILGTTTMEFEEGDTVFNVLCAVRDKYKLHMQYNGTGGAEYIQGINNLYEFDGGRWSGWMYCVNGWYPNYGCGQYACKDGDKIEWNYTCDLGKDLGQDWLGGDDWMENHE